MRDELAQAATIQAHQPPSVAPDANNTASASSLAAGGEVDACPDERMSAGGTPAQRVRRMEQLCAAAEGSLSALLDRLSTAVNMHDDMQRIAKAKAAEEQAQQAHHADHRKSRRSIAALLRRASVLPPRRVSAVDLAHARGAPGADRRGSIEMPIHHGGETVVSIDLEGDQRDDDPGPSVHTGPIPPQIPGANSFFPELPGLIHQVRTKAEELLVAAHSAAKGNPVGHHAITSQLPPVPPATTKAFNRTTMAGPAWIEAPSSASEKASSPSVRLLAVHCDTAESPRPSSPGGTHSDQQHSREVVASPTGADAACCDDLAIQQAVKASHALQVERYLQRLADATVDVGARQSTNPFTLESSDDDDQPVMDR